MPKVKKDSLKNSLLEIELQEAFAIYREQSSLIVQFSAGIIAANVAYIGYVFTVNKAELIIAGTLFPLGLLIYLSRARNIIIPTLLSALMIEEKNIGKNKGLVYEHLLYMQGQDYVNTLLSFREIENHDERQRKLRKIALPLGGRGLIRFALWLTAIGQFIIGILFLFFY